MRAETINADSELKWLCREARGLISGKSFDRCQELLSGAMAQFPHSPEPHNLMGIMLEKKGDHRTAMKHFRAAWALDPTYIPARQNLECFGTFFPRGQCAFELGDCVPEMPDHDHLRKRDYGVPKRG